MPIDAGKMLIHARALVEAGNNEAARKVLLDLLKERPDNEVALVMLGGSYFTGGKLHEAEMVFEQLILLQPGRGEFSIALFNTLWKQGRNSEALEEIKRFMAVADKIEEQETINQYVAISRKIAGNEE